jgi:hypothetical protein
MANQLFDKSGSAGCQPLDRTLRRELESVVVKAREIAEEAALAAITRLSVQESRPADYLTDIQRSLRNRLRAHGRQLGDIKLPSGVQGVSKLVSEVAYEHWHRMLFARFLEQNQLLMYDEHTPLTLEDCNELVKEEGIARDGQEARCKTGWELAGLLASKMLPQIFRIDSPVFELELAPNHRRKLEQLVTNLNQDTFQAQDSLGWVYQFWQTKRKDEVNKSEVKIGAEELSPVTQLFTEPYMVSFLLDNSLGAWWAGKRLSDVDWENGQNEQELRQKASIPGIPLTYLRFVKDDTSQLWQPASGTFESWPKKLSELKALDPCCGSGHFLVAAFLMLVPMRMHLEQLTAQEAVDRVLSENLHGLELDQRCVELAAFAVALEAWRFPNAGGYRSLPELNLACSGLSITAAKEEWKELSRKAGKQNLSIALDWMYQTFKNAPVLGSLINPRRSKATQIAHWSELQQLLGEALSQEQSQEGDAADTGRSENNNRIEAGIVAQGLAKAADLLAGQYTWVITNVPYLARGKQSSILRDFCEEQYPDSQHDLATVFIERCLEFCSSNGTFNAVLPQNWLFQKSYKRIREKVLWEDSLLLLSKLGAGAFETISGEVVKAILIIFGNRDNSNINVSSIDVSSAPGVLQKSQGLANWSVRKFSQKSQLDNPDYRITGMDWGLLVTLDNFVSALHGQAAGDNTAFNRNFWELPSFSDTWELYQCPTNETAPFSGRDSVVMWEGEAGKMAQLADSVKHLNHKAQQWRSGKASWGKKGIVLNLVGSINVTYYTGEIYSQSGCVMVPHDPELLIPLWLYASSGELEKELRELDSGVAVSVKTVISVPFDKDFWIAEAKRLEGAIIPIEKPFSNDYDQWLFHGHPCGSVIWDEETKRTAQGMLRVDDTVLQVAVARLLGYRWPAEINKDMELAEEQRAWVLRCQDLEEHMDDDGIVCLPPVRGELAADKRLEALLQDAYGKEWAPPLKNRLLETVGSKSLSLWLRDKFFEQHCKLFQNRPFIWHVWDGLKDGFSALVNYHQLDKAGLERLIYTYLGDWIRTQQAGVANGEDCADIRLAAAETLKTELEKILEGEKPYDIFVRWKPLAEQPIGWNPDLNDGVRLNIRPFLLARDLGKKGAGILRFKPNIKWSKDRGTDVLSAPWYHLGLEYGGKEGDRINEHHTTLAEKSSVCGLE